VRAIVRSPEHAAEWARQGCEIAIADLNQPSELSNAFAGTDGVFVMLPPSFDPSPGFPEAKAFAPQSLPKPNNPTIELKEIPKKRFAVIRFSGIAGEQSLKRYNKELEDFLSAKRLSPLSPPIYAFYNPPWTLPFLRRNEVLIEISGPTN
jgi:uncharacterized protein YbjT (DUF2867 family)